MQSKQSFQLKVIEVSERETVAEVFLTPEYSEKRVFDSCFAHGLLPGDECELTIITEGNQVTFLIQNLLEKDYKGC